MGSIVAGIAKEMSEIITDNDIDLESLDYDEIEEQFDIIKGHAMLLTKENEELKKKIEDLNRICLGAICWAAVEELTKDNMKLQDEIEQLKDRGDICEEIAKLKEELEVEKDGRDHDVQQFQETLSENGSLETEVEELKEELEEWKDAAEDTNSETPGELSDWIGASIHEDDELYSKYTEPLELRQEIEKLKEICMGMCKQLEDVTKHEISDPDHYYRGIKAVEELKEEIEGERLTQLLTLKVVKDKEEENKKLKEKNEELNTENVGLLEEINDEVARVNKENEKLKEEYNMWKASHDDDIREAREEGKGANEIIEKLREWYGEGGFMGTAMDQRFMNIINPPESE